MNVAEDKMQPIKVTLPLTEETVRNLNAGDMVLLSGPCYTARDAAHKRLFEMLGRGEVLPFDLSGATIYYVGPSPAPAGLPVGAAGPTSSYRMDRYTPELLKAGLRGMIGKGRRGGEVLEAMREYGAVYFGAVGGAAALLARCITKSEDIAFPDLGTEAIRRYTLLDFPVIVLADCRGGDFYRSVQSKAAGNDE